MIQNSFKGVFVNKVETVNSYLDYPDSLEKALQLALSICPDTVRMPQWAKYQLNLHLGRALLQTGKEQNGIHLIDRAAQDLINMKFMEGRDANEILMDYYLAKGMNDDFARCYIRNRQFADSLDNNEKKRAVAAANIRFDANQKEKETNCSRHKCNGSNSSCSTTSASPLHYCCYLSPLQPISSSEGRPTTSL